MVPMDLSSAPWAGLVWDTVNRRMIPESKQTVLSKVIFHGSGGDLTVLSSSADKLRRELAGLMNREPGDVRLRVFAK